VAAEGGASLPGLARVMQGMVTVHLEFAQREARADLSRVIGAVLLALVAGALGFFALGLGHVAAVLLLQARSSYDLLTSTGLVAGVDLALAALLALVAPGPTLAADAPGHAGHGEADPRRLRRLSAG
jgi:uncharacterized membrane protein YqjE